ncbi:ATP-binding protein [Mucilaginibacter endophyticus]|uniref:ATP-binding protein n=1 Tax=Mucilaginibacter endophyticus TaxID=2675003 RepID=UPI000E0D3767|nr:ATP-binding protein [Mucilaginibacter endophyticus]
MKFTYNPRVIRHLGTELITNDEVAVTELVKNSYDAGAKNVRLHLMTQISLLNTKQLLVPVSDAVLQIPQIADADRLMILEDNGSGMTKDVLRDAFFEVASDFKKELKNGRSEGDNIILGDKGIGRLSAQRLSGILIVETTSLTDRSVAVVTIDWEKFINDDNADAPEIYLDKNAELSYTRLWFIGTDEHPLRFGHFVERKRAFQMDIFENITGKGEEYVEVREELQTALSFLFSPFDEQKKVLDIEVFVDHEKAILNFNYQTIRLAETIHSFSTTPVLDENKNVKDITIKLSMEVRPWFIERMHMRELGKVLYQDYRLSPSGYAELLEKYQDKFTTSLSEEILLSDLIQKWRLDENFNAFFRKLTPAEGKIYSFKRETQLMRIAVNSAVANGYLEKKSNFNSHIKSFLDANNGVKLYRNRFRVGTIGSKGNDWLNLQQKVTSGQQFYRFEPGNIVGYINVNDPFQRYIYETSSREHLTNNLFVESLQSVLDYILEAFAPRFNKRAADITKDILDQEKLIPQNDTDDIKSEVKKSEDLLKAANANIKAIQQAFKVINENIGLESNEEIEAIKNVLKGLQEVSNNFEQNIGDAQQSFQSANKLLQIAEAEQRRIEVEAYNNYKLMANGLVTEVITHELHSLLSNNSSNNAMQEHFTALKDYLFELKSYTLNKNHLEPVKERFDAMFSKMSDLNRFYAFLEKTFLYKGNSHDFEKVSVHEYLDELRTRFDFRLKKNKIELRYDSVDQVWVVPKGSLTHVFYNLIDNAIAWIQERNRRAGYDRTFESSEEDYIIIEGKDPNTIHLYDSGTGVLDRYQHTLFNSLESGKENGRGMGLYIVKNFLRSFGADIELLPDKNSYNNRYIFEIRVKSNDKDSE